MVVTTKYLSSLVIIAVALAALTGIVYTMRSGPAYEFKEGDLLIQGLDPGKVAKITVRDGDKVAELKREGDDFTVVDRYDYRASPRSVNVLLLTMLEMKCAARVSSSPKMFEEQGVADNDKAKSVTLADNNGKTLVKLLIGKPSVESPGPFVRRADSDTVYAADRPLAISADPLSYVDRVLLQLPREDISYVTVQTKDYNYSIGRDNDGRAVLQDIPEGKKAKATAVDTVFFAPIYLACEDVAPADKTEVQWDATYTSRQKTPLTYKIRIGTKGEDHYMAISAEGPSQNQIEQSRAITPDEPKSELEKKDAVLTAATKAIQFNRDHSAWVYKMTKLTAEQYIAQPSQLVEDANAQEEPKEIAASHILIGYSGATRSQATRTRDEARKLAEEVLAKARAEGADFAALAREYSEDPTKGQTGDLGTFAKGMMAKAFEDAAWKLQVGQISDVVETPFGFHIIKRTK
jgi:hypothetical protein